MPSALQRLVLLSRHSELRRKATSAVASAPPVSGQADGGPSPHYARTNPTSLLSSSSMVSPLFDRHSATAISIQHFNVVLAQSVRDGRWKDVGMLELYLAEHAHVPPVQCSDSDHTCEEEADSGMGLEDASLVEYGSHHEMDGSAKPLRPNVETFQLFMAGRLQLGDWQGALDYFCDTRSECLPVADVTIRMAMRAFRCAAPMAVWCEALQLFRSFQHRVTSSQTLEEVVNILMAAGRFESVLGLYHETRQVIAMEPDVLRAVAQSAERVQQWSVACHLASTAITSRLPTTLIRDFLECAVSSMWQSATCEVDWEVVSNRLRLLTATFDQFAPPVRCVLFSEKYFVTVAKASAAISDLQILLRILREVQHHQMHDGTEVVQDLALRVLHRYLLMQTCEDTSTMITAAASDIIDHVERYHTIAGSMSRHPEFKSSWQWALRALIDTRRCDAAQLLRSMHVMRLADQWERGLTALISIDDAHRSLQRQHMECVARKKGDAARSLLVKASLTQPSNPVTFWALQQLLSARGLQGGHNTLQRWRLLQVAVERSWISPLVAERHCVHARSVPPASDALLAAALREPDGVIAKHVMLLGSLHGHDAVTVDSIRVILDVCFERTAPLDGMESAAEVSSLFRDMLCRMLDPREAYSVNWGISVTSHAAVPWESRSLAAALVDEGIIALLLQSDGGVQQWARVGQIASELRSEEVAAMQQLASDVIVAIRAGRANPFQEVAQQALTAVLSSLRRGDATVVLGCSIWAAVHISCGAKACREWLISQASACLMHIGKTTTLTESDFVGNNSVGSNCISMAVLLMQESVSNVEGVARMEALFHVLIRSLPCSSPTQLGALLQQPGCVLRRFIVTKYLAAHINGNQHFALSQLQPVLLLLDALATQFVANVAPSCALMHMPNVILLAAQVRRVVMAHGDDAAVRHAIDTCMARLCEAFLVALPSQRCGHQWSVAEIASFQQSVMLVMQTTRDWLRPVAFMKDAPAVARCAVFRVYIAWAREGILLADGEQATVLALASSSTQFDDAHRLMASSDSTWCNNEPMLHQAITHMTMLQTHQTNVPRLYRALVAENAAVLGSAAFRQQLVVAACAQDASSDGNEGVDVTSMAQLVTAYPALVSCLPEHSAVAFRVMVSAVQLRPQSMWRSAVRYFQSHVSASLGPATQHRLKLLTDLGCDERIGKPCQVALKHLTQTITAAVAPASLPSWLSFIRQGPSNSSACDWKTCLAEISCVSAEDWKSITPSTHEKALQWCISLLTISNEPPLLQLCFVVLARLDVSLDRICGEDVPIHFEDRHNAQERWNSWWCAIDDALSAQLLSKDECVKTILGSASIRTMTMVASGARCRIGDWMAGGSTSHLKDLWIAYMDRTSAEIVSLPQPMRAPYEAAWISCCVTLGRWKELLVAFIQWKEPRADESLQDAVDSVAADAVTLIHCERLWILAAASCTLNGDPFFREVTVAQQLAAVAPHGLDTAVLRHVMTVAREGARKHLMETVCEASLRPLRTDEWTRAAREGAMASLEQRELLHGKRHAPPSGFTTWESSLGVLATPIAVLDDVTLSALQRQRSPSSAPYHILQALSLPHTPARVHQRWLEAAIEGCPSWEAAVRLFLASRESVPRPTAVQRYLSHLVLEQTRLGQLPSETNEKRKPQVPWDVALRMFLHATDGKTTHVVQRHFVEVMRHCVASPEALTWLFERFRANRYERREGINPLLSLLHCAKLTKRSDLALLAVEEFASCASTLSERNRSKMLSEISQLMVASSSRSNTFTRFHFSKVESQQVAAILREKVTLSENEAMLVDMWSCLK